jgi:hypothetical protein
MNDSDSDVCFINKYTPSSPIFLQLEEINLWNFRGDILLSPLNLYSIFYRLMIFEQCQIFEETKILKNDQRPFPTYLNI